MNIIREPFLGGEQYICTHCARIVEENYYPTDHVSTSAAALFNHEPEEARKIGIFFSGRIACNCEDPENRRHD